MGRIEKTADENLAEDQFGFRKNRGTREAILCLRNIVEKSFEVNQKVYIAFVDLLKTFNNVNWNVMMKILEMIKIHMQITEIEELLENYTNVKRHL